MMEREAMAAEWAAAEGVERDRGSAPVARPRHLLHVGSSKTGSKYLQRWFATNPQLAFSQWGMLGAPDTLELIQRVAFGEFKYHVTSCETFMHPVRGYQHFDFRPGIIPRRANQLKMCRFLADMFREPKVLAVTRGFREIIWSTYAEMVRSGASYSLDDFCRWLERDIDRGRNPLDYDFLLNAYGEAFGEANLIVLPYELLQKDPDRFIAELEQALGLDPHPAPPYRIHESLSPQKVYWYPRFSRLTKALPVGPRLRGRAFEKFVYATRKDKLDRLVRLLDRVRPGSPVTRDLIPDRVVERFRGTTLLLKDRPLYRDLGEEYLF